MSTLSISVVIYKTPPKVEESFLSSLLNSIKHLRKYGNISDVQLFIINNSDYQTASQSVFLNRREEIDELCIAFQFLTGHGNIGYGRAHNLVLNQIKSDHHLILNPDVTFENDSILQALTTIDSDKNIKLLSPFAYDLEGKKQYLCKSYPSILTLFLRGFAPKGIRRFFAQRLSAYEVQELSDNEPNKGVEIISGCFMLINTAVWKKVEGFDERFFLYFEDFDLSIRVGRLGDIIYAPNVRIRHGGGNASSKGLRHLRAFISSGVRFFNKHGWRFF